MSEPDIKEQLRARAFAIQHSAAPETIRLLREAAFHIADLEKQLAEAQAIIRGKTFTVDHDLERQLAKAREVKPRVRHIKRGTTYEVLGRGLLQTNELLYDDSEVVVYRSEADGRIWVRPREEFDDPARFEALKGAKP